MTNNLLNLKKDLKSFAKKCKDFKYTDSALLTFLLNGMLISTGEMFAETVTKSQINNQVSQINTSINQMRTDFKHARAENNKLIRDTNLELTQLMEQGDHVTKSPWSSWQIGANDFYNDWHGAYKGRGDKQTKYPYEGIFNRYGSETLGSQKRILRYIKPEKLDYYNTSVISADSDSASALTTNRVNVNGYGLISNNPVTTTAAQIQLNASITPRTIDKTSPLSAPQGTNLLTPDFNPPVITPPNISMSPITISVNVPTVTIPAVNPPTISAPSTGNGDESWIQDSSGNYIKSDYSSGSYAAISQQKIDNGSMTVTASPTGFDLTTNGTTFTGIYGPSHQEVNPQTLNLSQTGYNINNSFYEAMKLIGGHEIQINGVAINFSGTGSGNYDNWLFHTDGHNDYGESTWVLNNGTSVNVTGNKLIMYTSQYHWGTPYANIGFVNEGTISFSGTNNIGWVALDEDGDRERQQYFHNKGTVNFLGNNNIIAYINSPYSPTNSGWSFINDGTMTLGGTGQFGIITGSAYPASEILLNKKMEISGNNNVGAVFRFDTDLDGGEAFSQSTADNIVTILPAISRASVLNFDISGTSNTGMYFKSSSDSTPSDPSTFNIKKSTINITGGTGGVGLLAEKAIINYGDASNTPKIKISGGSNNVGIAVSSVFTHADKNEINSYANIKLSGGTNNLGIAATTDAKFANYGKVEVTATGNTGIVANGSQTASLVTGSGATASIDSRVQNGDGTIKGIIEVGAGNSAGMAAVNNGAIKNTSTGTINVTAGAGMYTDSNSLAVNYGTIKAHPASTGTGTVGVYNLGTFNNFGTNLEADGKGSASIYSSGTVNLGNSSNEITAKNKAAGLYLTGGTVNTNGAKINISGGSAGIFAGSGTPTVSSGGILQVIGDGAAAMADGGNLNLTGVDLRYTGTGSGGFGFYVNKNASGVTNGSINFTNGTLTLMGNSVAGMEYKLGTGPVGVNLSGATINVFSDSGVAFLFDRNATMSLQLNGLTSTLFGGGGIPTVNYTDTAGIAGTAGKIYAGKLGVIDGITSGTLTIGNGKVLDKTNTSDIDIVNFGRLLIQRAKVNINDDIKAEMTQDQAISFGDPSVVGYAISSSNGASSNADTKITVQNGSTISADNTGNTGNSAVGLYINYGQIENNGTINVEKTGTGTTTGGTGIFAVNSSEVTNKNIISVGGQNSIGIYGASYRNNPSTGTPLINEFVDSTGTVLTDQGKVDIINDTNGLIELDGANSVGIYAEDNSVTGQQVKAVNKGKINMTGTSGTGMAGKNFSIIENANSGTINVEVDNGVGMFGEGTLNGTVLNSGTINLGASSSDTTLRTGMFTKSDTILLNNTGTINAKSNGSSGAKTYGIYNGSNNGIVKLNGNSNIIVGDEGVGVYSTSGNVQIDSGKIKVGNNNAVGVFIERATNGVLGNSSSGDASGDIEIGNSSYGYVAKGTTGQKMNLNNTNVKLGDNSVYTYTNDTTSIINNSSNLTSTGNTTYGIYSAGEVNNSGTINFETGIGNVGIYSTNASQLASNTGTIIVGQTDEYTKRYAIGMAAGYNGQNGGSPFTGNIENKLGGTITVKGKKSIGMYGTQAGTTVTNSGTINLAEDNAIGMYLDNGATGINQASGVIQTVAKSDGSMPIGAIGVVLKNGSVIKNYGQIIINSAGGSAIYNDKGDLTNSTTGTTTVSGGAKAVDEYVALPTSVGSSGPSGTQLEAPAGVSAPTVLIGGIVQPITATNITTPQGTTDMLYMNGVGIYIDTLGATNPIVGLGNLGLEKVNLIIGAEAAKATTNKYIHVSDEIMKPYLQSIAGIKNFNVTSGALHWVATTTNNNNDVWLLKLPYTDWAGNEATPTATKDTYNFLDGLEQRYGVEALGTRENQLFQKLNGIGSNEAILFYQAADEMMGHQYGNTQLRINATGNLLDKEFKYLKHDWRNPSKQNNKIKAFGMRDEYKTDTAGIIDYTSNAYGVAYVHEDEKVKMGNSSGWYAGAVTNRFKFKDIGHSREDQTMVKLGIFKTMSPKKDYNGSLQWTIGGDVFAGVNNMKRKFLVVDDVFEAKSNYNSYGAALKTDLGYDIRMSERTHLRPYGGLKMEYGRFNNIKEDSGQMRLEVKGNDYFSVKPEAGVEFKYIQPLAVRTNLTVGLTAAYENELGKVGDVKNEGRVRYTTADWFGIRGEKEDRRGNGKFDLNIGVDNTRFGVTVNAGYDTKGSNIRGGIGFRAIY